MQGILEAFLAENPRSPGATLTVMGPEAEAEWSGAAGTVAHGDPTPLTPRHTFRIASNTKTYVAAAVLRLVEMGRVGLDDPLNRHLPPGERALLEGGGYDAGAITLAQVLSHTAGFGDPTQDPRFEERIFADHDYPWTAQEHLRLLVEWADPAGKPGEKYAYSDSGYILLGTLVERWTGRRLGPAVRELLGYDRLGLKATHWEYMEAEPADAGPRAHQYHGDRDVTGWTASYDLYGGGGMVADSRELALFLRLLLKGKVFDRPGTLEQMTSRGTLPYRLGLMVAQCDGRIVLGHQGFWNTFAFHIPSLDLTVAGSLMNHHATGGLELVRRIASAAADEKGTKDGSGAGGRRPRPPREYNGP